MSEQCPISGAQINEKAARLVAFFVLSLSACYAIMSGTWFIGLLTVDFAVRAFISSKFSPLSQLSCLILRVLKTEQRMIDAAPKLFAAKIGFFLCLVATCLALLNAPLAARAVAGIIAFCAALEAFLGFCIGCKVYVLAIRIKQRGG